MADIKLRIELNPNADSEALGNITNANELGSTNENLSNTSIGASAEGVFYDIQMANGEGSNGLTWAEGYLVFNEDGYLDNVENSNAYLESEQNPTQVFWGVVPSSKEYYVKLTFSNATSLKEITILGDKLTNQFPTRAILDGTLEIFSDDPEWNIEFPTESDTHTIEFTHWNRGNYNATITKIAILGKYLHIDKANGLKSVETLTQSSSSPSDIFYGVLPNSGSAELLDVNGELHDMIVDGVISDSNVKFDVLANGNIVGSHYTQDTNYNNQSKVVSFEMGDGLANWDSLIYSGYDLVEGSRTVYEMLLAVFESLGYNSTQVDKMLETEIIYGNDNVTGSVKSYLEQIVIQYPYLLSDTYRNTVDKFCKLAQLQLLQMDNGELKFVSARPLATLSEFNNAIVIGSKNQFSQFERPVILKNKIHNVKVVENVVSLKEKEVASAYGEDSSSIEEINFRIDQAEIIRNKNGGVFGRTYIKSNRFRFTFNAHEGNEIFVKDQNHLRIKEVSSRSNIVKTYHDGVFGSTLGDSVSVTSSISEFVDNPSIEYFSVDENGNFKFEFYSKVLKYFEQTGSFSDLAGGEAWTEFFPEKTNFYIVADCIESVPKDVIYNPNNSSGVKEINVGSELLQVGTTYRGAKISEIIINNIINDYSDGISDGTITISCADYYNENAEKIKDWASGQIISVGDIIVPKKDNSETPLVKYRNGNEYKWRVKGVTFRKGGAPFLDLQVQEIRQP